MVDALVGVAQEAGLPVRREQGLPDMSRPGDVFFPRLNVDGPCAVDVTVRDPLAPSHPVQPSQIDQWHSRQEGEKDGKYAVQSQRRGWQFTPLVLDVFGGCGEKGQH